MLRNIVFLIIGISFSVSTAYSQDIHYSQFFNSPLNLNPALTGIFNGNVRMHANYKDQWAGVPVGYSSADLGFDMKQQVGKKGHFLGFGALVNYDRAGDLDLGWTGGNLFLSLSLKLGNHSFITPGVTVGYYQRSLNPANVTTGNQSNGKGVDPTISAETINNESVSFGDLGLGLNYRWQKNFRKHLDLGASLAHVNGPETQFLTTTNTQVDRPQRLSAYGIYQTPLGDKLDLILNGLYSVQDAYEEIVLNIQGKIYLNSSKSTALYLGVGTRLEDALYPLIGLEVGPLYGAFSYDLNNSNFDVATNGRGGPELSLRYIWSKVPEVAYNPCLIY